MLLYATCVRLFDINSVSIWDFFDCDYVLQKGDLLFKSLNNYKYLRIEDLPQEIFIKKYDNKCRIS